jgi:hypothetical protein
MKQGSRRAEHEEHLEEETQPVKRTMPPSDVAGSPGWPAKETDDHDRQQTTSRQPAHIAALSPFQKGSTTSRSMPRTRIRNLREDG